MPSHSSCAEADAQRVEPLLLGGGRIDRHDQCPGARVRFHRPGQGPFDLAAPRWCHAPGEALQLVGVRALLAGEIAVAAAIAATAVDPAGLPQPGQQHRHHGLVLAGRETIEVNSWHQTTMPEDCWCPSRCSPWTQGGRVRLPYGADQYRARAEYHTVRISALRQLSVNYCIIIALLVQVIAGIALISVLTFVILRRARRHCRMDPGAGRSDARALPAAGLGGDGTPARAADSARRARQLPTNTPRR